MRYVLRETLASKKNGKPIYFHYMTAIGPANTADYEQATFFESREAAMGCPAYHHSLSCYDIEEAP